MGSLIRFCDQGGSGLRHRGLYGSALGRSGWGRAVTSIGIVVLALGAAVAGQPRALVASTAAGRHHNLISSRGTVKEPNIRDQAASNTPTRCTCTGSSCPAPKRVVRGARALSFRRDAIGSTDLSGPRASVELPGASAPGNDHAVIFSNFPQDAEPNDNQPKGEISHLTSLFTSEGYTVTLYSATKDGPGSATIQNFLKAAGAGIFIISSHGSAPETDFGGSMMVEEWFNHKAEEAAWKADSADPALGGKSFSQYFQQGSFPDRNRESGGRIPDAFDIDITSKGIEHFFGSGKEHHSMIFGGTCYSAWLARAFDAQTYFGYALPSTDPQVWDDWNTLFGFMTGETDDGRARTAVAAFNAGFLTHKVSTLRAYLDAKVSLAGIKAGTVGEAGDMTLSPAVKSVTAPPGDDPPRDGSYGPFALTFDSQMDEAIAPASLLKGTASSGTVTLSNIDWLSPLKLQFFATPQGCSQPCRVEVEVHALKAVSSGGKIALDGNTDPTAPKANPYGGIEPNGRDFVFTIMLNSWQALPVPTPKGTTAGFMNAVACPSTKTCIGVGEVMKGSSELPIVVRESKGELTTTVVPLPGGMTAGGLSEVACGAEGQCTATGEAYSDPSNPSTGQAFATNIASTLSSLLLPVPAGYQMSSADALGCAGAGDCIATGQAFEASNSSEHHLLEIESGGAWHAMADLVPSNAHCLEASCGGLGNIVACQASAATCYSFGAYQTTQGLEWMVAPVTQGSATAVEIPTSAAGQPGDLALSACPSKGDCTTIGRTQFSGPSNQSQPLLVTGTGSTWVTSEGGPGYGIRALACPVSAGCIAVMPPSAGEDQVDVENGSTWSLVTVPAPAGAAATPDTEVNLLACPLAGWCAAVGSYLAAGSGSDNAFFVDDGGAWTAQTAPIPVGATSEGIAGIACIAKDDCGAVGTYGSGGSELPIFFVRRPQFAVQIGPPAS